MATKGAFLCGCFVHVIQVFVESTVSSDELGSGSVVFSVGYKGSVEVVDIISICNHVKSHNFYQRGVYSSQRSFDKRDSNRRSFRTFAPDYRQRYRQGNPNNL